MIKNAAFSQAFGCFFHIKINFSPLFHTVVSLVSINQSAWVSNKLSDSSENVVFKQKQQYGLKKMKNFSFDKNIL